MTDSARHERLDRYLEVRRRLLPRTSRLSFEQLVAEAIDNLPEYARERIENVAIVVEDLPQADRIRSVGLDPEYDGLLGLYEGIPRGQRGQGYHMVPPDRITLYRNTILAQTAGGGEQALVREIRKTLIHEVGHHFGLSDADIAQLEQAS